MPGQLPAAFFGMTVNTIGNINFPSVSFGGLRMWDTQVTWKDIETSSGAFTWTLLDQWISEAQANNKDVLYTFGKVPTWAGGVNFVGPPSDISTGDNFFKAFVTALVTRYKGQIAFYELWNEPNVASTSPGTPAQLLIMAQDAYTIIKSIDPAAMVVGPSGSGGTAINSYILQYYTAAQTAGFIPQDIFSYHAYLGDGLRNPSTGMPLILNDIHVKKNTFGISSQPTWFTEGSWGDATTYTPSLSNDEQVAYLAQQYLFMWNSSIGRYYWYAWDNTKNFGPLWDSTNGIHPAGTAYGLLRGWLVGSTQTVALAQDGNGNWSASLTLAGGNPAKIVWNPTTTFSFPTTFTNYYTLDNATQNTVSNGQVSVGGKPLLLLNGTVNMAGEKGNTNSINYLKLVFQAVNWANIADNTATAPLTNLFVSLHTADPTAAGTQTSSEAAYTGYARVAVARTSGGWTLASETITNAGTITFPACTGGSETETFAGVGTATSGTGVLLWAGPLTSGLAVSNGITPSFNAGALSITEG